MILAWTSNSNILSCILIRIGQNAIHLMRQFDRLMAYHWHRPTSPLPPPPFPYTHTHTFSLSPSLFHQMRCISKIRQNKIKIRFESYAYGTLKRQVTDVTRMVLWNVRWRYAYGTLKRRMTSVGHIAPSRGRSDACLWVCSHRHSGCGFMRVRACVVKVNVSTITCRPLTKSPT